MTSFGVNYATGLMDNPPRTFEEHLEFARKAAERGLCKIKLWTCDDVELFEALQQAYDEAGLLDCLEVMIHVPNGRVAAVAYETGEASDIIDIVAPYSFIKSVVVGNELDFASTAVPGDQAALDALPRALANMKGKGLVVTMRRVRPRGRFAASPSLPLARVLFRAPPLPSPFPSRVSLFCTMFFS